MQVIKRNGELVDFNQSNIEEAILGAAQDLQVSFDGDDFKDVMNDIIEDIEEDSKDENISVEDIQDIVENELIYHNYLDIAKQFIRYRYDRKKIREFVETKEAFIEKYKNSSNTADATVDDNSNVSSKNIAICNNEIHKPDNIQVNRGMVMRQLKTLYPDFNAKQYIKDLKKHRVYKHDESSNLPPNPYCVSETMYPFLLNGIKDLGGLSAAPKNLDSFCGIYINMIFAVSSQFAGAVATPEFLLYFDYFARQEWGDDYYMYLDDVVNPRSKHPRTIHQQIHQHFQQVIYSINQPSAARGMQSAFINFAYFDKPFFDGMFGHFYFPDGTQPIWDSLNWLQKDFMQWFNAERLKTILTFPVESFALVYKDGEFVDKENADFVAEEYARGHSFFTYISDTVDSLSSCCFEGDEMIEINQNNQIKSMSISDFVNDFNNEDDPLGKKIQSDSTIRSYTETGEEDSDTEITGILKKKYSGNLYIFDIDGKSIAVTPDHLLLVKNINTQKISSVPAKTVYEHVDDYLLATE